MTEQPQNIRHDNENIVRLDLMDHVRRRPGMYIGGTDTKALHHLIYFLVDHAVELSLAGKCDHIWITLRDQNEVIFRDNGVEIPQVVIEQFGHNLLELFLTQIGISSERVHGFPLKRVSGLMSVGLWAINALSEWLTLEATFDGYLWKQEHSKGVPQTDVTKVRKLNDGDPKGITITFRPDFSIFQQNDFDYGSIISRLQQTAYLAPNLTITVVDERRSPPLHAEFHSPNGMTDLVRDINENKATLHETIHYQGNCITNNSNYQETYDVEFALQYTDSNNTVIKSYVNTYFMDGGTHVQGLQAALVEIINDRIGNESDKPFTWDEIQMGLTVGLNVKTADPSFESQSRINLLNPSAHEAVVEVVRNGMSRANIDAIIEKCKANRRNPKGMGA